MSEAAVVLLAKKPLLKKGFYLISADVDRLKDGVRMGCSLVQFLEKLKTKKSALA